MSALRTATQHTFLTPRTSQTYVRPERVRYIILRIFSVPVLAPLEHIPVHVMQPPGIGGKTTDRSGLVPQDSFCPVAVDKIAVVVCLLRGDRFAEMEGRRRAGTTSILPF